MPPIVIAPDPWNVQTDHFIPPMIFAPPPQGHRATDHIIIILSMAVVYPPCFASRGIFTALEIDVR